MALRFLESFDAYPLGNGATTLAAMLNKWTAATGVNIRTGNGGRNGTAGCQSNNTTLYKTFAPGLASWVVGFAYTPHDDTDTVYRGFEGGNAGTEHVRLSYTAANVLTYGRAGTVLSTGTTVLSINSTYYIEIKYTVHDSTGSYTVKINGATEFTASGVDTRNSGTAGLVDTHNWTTGSTANFELDDIYICDTTGGVNDDFLGDTRVEARFPDGNGNSSQLAGSDGNSTDNYQLVDESPGLNSDTDYVSSATPGDKDTYTFQNLTPTGGTVRGVQIVAQARKDDAGARSIVTVARLSATETDGPVQTLSTSYAGYADIRETKPGGGSWSISDVNSAEFGVKINA